MISEVLFLSNSERYVSTFNLSISDQGCKPDEKRTMVVHGWLGGINAYWVADTLLQLLKHRGGCVFFMDYGKYANVSNYFDLVPHLYGVSAVLTKKLKQIGGIELQYFYCHSFGSRVCIESGIEIGNRSIPRMDLCDPAGPGFDGPLQGPLAIFRRKDPKRAGKNVACINTSTFKGTTVYNCHQNFRMGDCSTFQIGSTSNRSSHQLCPIFYINSFDNKFEPNNYYGCYSPRMANFSISADIRLGYFGDFDRTKVRGDIFIATAKYPPYLVVNEIIDNARENVINRD